MDLSSQLHLAAGVATLGMGAAVLLREPGRLRNRLFALLCGALALWNLGFVANVLAGGGLDLWNRAFLLGSCAAAPLGLHFTLALARRERRGAHRLLLGGSYLLAGLLWLSCWTPLYEARRGWNLTAFAVLGIILLGALAVLLRAQARLAPGPERRALRLLLAGGVPMLAGVLLAVVAETNNRLMLGIIFAAGLIGFAFAFVIYRILQEDLTALTQAVRQFGSQSPGEDSPRAF